MLTRFLLDVTLLGAEWVLWLLAALSVLSIAVMIERGIYFSRRSFKAGEGLLAGLRAGRLDEARRTVDGQRGLVPDVLGAGLAHAHQGEASVEAVLASELAEARAGYERLLPFLGTLGNNAPFLGLFGTVLGIIRAFADLAAAGEQGGADVVMAGISEALVATAVGLFVALPAVVAYNAFARWQRGLVGSAQAAGQALLAGLRARGEPEAPGARKAG